ncbi:gliding motility ABC transporter [Leptospira langatensis]|uniref:Gliding motility ABC transporter n=1 Tax=Leptospira langatensis TaxID=2484983 RepID=A0A5F1ZPC5_9LEPT|nr:GldG family protein [Leptospira langatensis]TGK05553.1 gliding motility ABC transporter [Leptospira langatensis]TGL38685.1 gliding motility ABC transporter [Leptospira langatensis]
MRELLEPLFRIANRPWFLFLNGIVLFFLLNGIVSSFRCKADLSRSGRFQITESTKKVLSDLDSTLYIDAFYSSEIPGEYKSRLELTKGLLKEIAAVGKENVSLRFHDPDHSEEDSRKALELGLEPQILQRTSRDSASVKQAFLGIVLTLGHKTEVLSLAFFTEELEYQILNALQKMQRQDKDSGIAILRTKGSLSLQENHSPKDRIGIFFHQVLPREYGPISEIDPETDEIPEGIDLLLWAGSGPLSNQAAWRIDQFLMKGGSLLLLAKSMEFQTGKKGGGFGLLNGELSAGLAGKDPESEELIRLLEHYGIRINSDIILDPDDSLPMGSIIEIEPGILGKYPYPPWIVSERKTNTLDPDSPFTKSQESLLLPWSSSLTLLPEKQKAVKLQALAKSGPDAEARTEPISLGEKQILSAPIRANGGPFILSALAEGKFSSYFVDRKNLIPKGSSNGLLETKPDRVSKILVFGSPYLVSDLLAFPEFVEILKNSNIPFLLNSIDLLRGETDLIQARSKQSAILKMKPLSFGWETAISLFHLLGIPALLSLYAFRRIRKRNRQVL